MDTLRQSLLGLAFWGALAAADPPKSPSEPIKTPEVTMPNLAVPDMSPPRAILPEDNLPKTTVPEKASPPAVPADEKMGNTPAAPKNAVSTETVLPKATENRGVDTPRSSLPLPQASLPRVVSYEPVGPRPPEPIVVEPVGDWAKTEAKKATPAGSFLIDGELFLWAPRLAGQDYAILGTNPNMLGVVGTVKSVEGGYDPGFRLNAGYRFANGLEATFGYTHWHSSSNDQVSADGSNQVFPTLTHPSFTPTFTSAQAANSMNLNVFDGEIGRRFDVNEGTKVRAFFGPRLANFDQSFTTNYLGSVVSKDSVRRKLTFDGGGLRVGGSADFRVLDSIGLFLRGSAGLMTGRLRSTLEETADNQPIVNVVDRFNRVVPTADLGVGFSYSRGNLKMSLGYEFQNWFGMIEGMDFADDVTPAKMSRRYTDLGFDGIFFRAEWAF